MKPLKTLSLVAPLALAACMEDVAPPATVTEMQNTCAEELAHRLYLERSQITVTGTNATNRGTTGIVVDVTLGTESAYCEVDASGRIVAFTRL